MLETYLMMTFLVILLIHQKKALSSIKNGKNRGKLRHKWTYERVDKESDETINKKYVEYKQSELNDKGEKTTKALGKHAVNLYSTGISRFAKIKDVKKLRQDIENDPIIKDQVADLGCLLVCTLSNFVAPVLIAAHTANYLDFGNESEDEGNESERPENLILA